MKTNLLVLVLILFGFGAFSQQAYKFKIDTKEKKALDKPALGAEPLQSMALTNSDYEVSEIPAPPADRDVDIVTIVDIGTSANPWSYAIPQLSALWVSPMNNTVTHFHRMGGNLDPGGTSGDLGFDISTDGGATWTNQTEVYESVDPLGLDLARYPNHAVANATGNPEDAYVTFFAPLLDGSNSADSWGGWLFGTANISDPSITTKTMFTTEGDTYREVAEGFTYVPATNKVYGLGLNEDWTTGSLIYMQEMILSTGTWDSDQNMFVYEEIKIDAPCTDEVVAPATHKIAFGPDGMTGYIVLLTDNGEAEQVGGSLNYYPVVYKTTDGGETWSDPEFIQLDGPDGLGGIVYEHLSDEQIANLFEEPLPEREEISYTTAFDCDLVVDKFDNLHIAVVISATASDPHSIVSAEDYIQAYDLFTKDGGMSWEVERMGYLKRFRGTFGTLEDDNRIRIATNYDRDKIFVTWVDTDLEDEENNNRPNLWCRGFDPFVSPYMKTMNTSGEDAATNVTNFSAGMWQSFLGTSAKVTLEPTPGTYLLPMTYVELDPTDDLQPVQYKYITDFAFTEADFTITSVNDAPKAISQDISISQNYPNPFNGKTYVTVDLAENADLSLEVFNITGQLVSSQDYGHKTAGSSTLAINGEQLTPGIYFYTVKAGDKKLTRKMIVE